METGGKSDELDRRGARLSNRASRTGFFAGGLVLQLDAAEQHDARRQQAPFIPCARCQDSRLLPSGDHPFSPAYTRKRWFPMDGRKYFEWSANRVFQDSIIKGFLAFSDDEWVMIDARA